MNGLRLYGRYVSASIRAQMQYPSAFLIVATGQFVTTLLEFAGIWALFYRFGQIRGWRLPEVAIFYGTVSVSFALADAITRGFDAFGPELIKTGDFDRLLLRPRALVLQLLGHELRVNRIGRLTQGALVLVVAASMLEIEWTAASIGLLLAAIAGAVALFVAIWVLQATLAIWTVESLEIVNALTYGGVEAGQYPLDIYARWFRDFLIFVVPIGCVVYFPVLHLLGHQGPLAAHVWLLDVSPAFGFVFLALALQAWKFGVKHYTSTGS